MGRATTIAPSILSADFANLARDIARAEDGGADVIHVDVMDGHFVPNLTLGPPVVSSIRRITRLPLDVHLMIDDPGKNVASFIRAGADWISVHVEADLHLHRTLQQVKEMGAHAGVALNPATPLSLLEEILPLADFVLVMSVNPGFAGQEFIPGSLRKIRALRERIDSNGLGVRVEVDGGISADNLRDVLSAGAEIIVAGSAIFNHAGGAGEAVREFRQIADSHARVLETT